MGPKKAATKSHSPKKSDESTSPTQPLKQRKAAEAHLKVLVEKFTPSQVRLVSAIRKWLRQRLPTVVELIYEYRDCFVISFSPNENGYEGVFSIKGKEDDVKLYFNRGKDLEDPTKLLKGSGRLVRMVDIDSAAKLKLPELIRLVDQAIELYDVPFETEGDGAVVIKQ